MSVLTRLATLILVLAATVPTHAQYQLHRWASFEDGQLPDDKILLGATNASVVELSTVKGMDEGFRAGIAGLETAKYGLQLTAAPVATDIRSHKTAIGLDKVLERSTLGDAGKALYQADFFLPGPGQELPSLAVLALRAEDDPNVKTVRNPFNLGFYRFGLTLGNTLFFSYVQPGKKEAVMYVTDNNLLAQIPRPGWHRFSVVFEGKSTIRCFVDGRQTSFSPLQEPSLKKLKVGVMLAEPKRSYLCYADNMSIQVSTEAELYPQSPYTAGWKTGETDAARGQYGVAKQDPVSLAGQTGNWLEPATAWETAKSKNVPMLLYFYAPGIPATKQMEAYLRENSKAREFVSKHVAARVDVNQLQGGSIAMDYKVFKVPTLLVISPDAQWYRRAMMLEDSTWESMEEQLKKP